MQMGVSFLPRVYHKTCNTLNITKMKLTVGSDAIFLFSHMNSRTAMKQETIIPPVKTMKTPPRFGKPSCALLPPSPPYDNFWEKEKKQVLENIFFIVCFFQNHCPQKNM